MPAAAARFLASPVTNSATAVSNGLFTVTIDFGPGVFTGASNWLAIAVRTNGNGAFSTLAPRQLVTPTPYAIMAGTSGTAGGLSGTVPASQLSGVVSLAQLPAAVMTNGATGVSLAGFFAGNFGGSFYGNGAGLTGLNPANLSPGTVTINITGGAAVASNVVSGIAITNAVITSSIFNGNGAGVTNVAFSLLNGGSYLSWGSFAPPSTLTVGPNPVFACAGDVNGDGKIDLISANYENGFGSTLTVLTNNGNGVFGFNATLTVGGGPQAVVAADVNGDGKVDLIIANYTINTVTVNSNNGS